MFKITGDKELVAALRTLGKGLPVAAVDRAVTEAARPMHADAVQNARAHRQPGRTPKGGHLDQGIVFRRRKESTKNKRRYVLGGVRRARWLLKFLEFGTARHWQPKRFGGIWHPGARAFPIMRPAYEDHADQVSMNFGRDIVRQIEALASRLNRGRR